jgi:hypothetical protein
MQQIFLTFKIPELTYSSDEHLYEMYSRTASTKKQFVLHEENTYIFLHKLFSLLPFHQEESSVFS